MGLCWRSGENESKRKKNAVHSFSRSLTSSFFKRISFLGTCYLLLGTSPHGDVRLRQRDSRKDDSLFGIAITPVTRTCTL